MGGFWTFFCSFVGVVTAENLGRGFGDNIEWVTYTNGLKKAGEQNKAIMIIYHKPWCSACNALKPEFSSSEEILELSKNFVMVNIEEDEELGGEKPLAPDGSYIPRIYFLEPSGKFMDDMYNLEGNEQYKYFYYDAGSVVQSMERVLLLFPSRRVDDEL